MLLTALLSVLKSSAFGSIIGAVTGIFTRKVDIEHRRLDIEDRKSQREHEIKLREWDLKIMEQEWAGRGKVAMIEGEAEFDQSRAEAIGKVLKYTQPEKGSWIAKFASFIRPFVSIGYFILTTVGAVLIVYYAFCVYTMVLDDDQIFKLVLFVVEWVTWMASGTIGYYFVMRAGKEPPKMRI